jgi:ABC-type branched-subunit amino acid transport system substrate-binding protein
MSGQTELPASVLPCSSCHGEDGRGNPEGGVNPSDLTWQALTRPYGVRHESGREHPPYDERLLKRAIGLGVDPAGTELHVSMPRYRMTIEDMEALIAYMRQLGSDRDPGVEEEALTLGTLLPPEGRVPGLGGAIEGVLGAWAADLNERGGLYGRKVEIRALELPDYEPARPPAVSRFLEEERVFSLVGAFLAGSEGDLPSMLAEARVPLVGPFTLRPELTEPVNPYVFYLLPGLSEQGRALVRFAAERLRAAAPFGEALPTATILRPEGSEEMTALSAAMMEAGEDAGWPRLEERTYTAGAIDPLGLSSLFATIDSRALFFLGPPDDRLLLLRAAGHFDWHPEVYALGSMAGSEAFATPADFDGRMFLAFPTLPDDRTEEAFAAYRRLAEAHGLPREHLATQVTTLAAARLFEEAAKRAGRDLSRSKLVAELESFYKWRTGLIPPLTYHANRRIGAQGAYVVALDLEGRTFQRVGGWVETD